MVDGYKRIINKIKLRKVGMSGLGSIGIRHYNNLKKLTPNIITYDPKLNDEKRLRDIYKNCSDVFICSPLQSHEKYLKKLIKLEKNIFIEKPFILNVKKYKNLVLNYKKKNKLIYVGFNLRFRNIIKFIKKEIDSKKFGKIYWAKFLMSSYLPSWRKNYDIKSSYTNSKLFGGVLLDSIHELDLAEFFFGPSKLKASYLKNYKHLKLRSEEYANITLAHKNNIVSNIQLDYLNKNHKRTVTICGSKKYLEADIRNGVIINNKYARLNKKFSFIRNTEYVDEILYFFKLVINNRKNNNLISNLNIHSMVNDIKRNI